MRLPPCHKIGDTFDYDTDRGKLCPMAMHVAFPYIDILRYGGTPPTSCNGELRFCCPDVDVINVFRLEAVQKVTEFADSEIPDAVGINYYPLISNKYSSK